MSGVRIPPPLLALSIDRREKPVKPSNFVGFEGIVLWLVLAAKSTRLPGSKLGSLNRSLVQRWFLAPRIRRPHRAMNAVGFTSQVIVKPKTGWLLSGLIALLGCVFHRPYTAARLRCNVPGPSSPIRRYLAWVPSGKSTIHSACGFLAFQTFLKSFPSALIQIVSPLARS